MIPIFRTADIPHRRYSASGLILGPDPKGNPGPYRDCARLPEKDVSDWSRSCERIRTVSVNDQWRICFLFEDGEAYDV